MTQHDGEPVYFDAVRGHIRGAWAQQGGAVYDDKPGPAWEWAAEERRRR